jgi:hypothetical protein
VDPTTGRTQAVQTRALIENSLMSPRRRHPNYIGYTERPLFPRGLLMHLRRSAIYLHLGDGPEDLHQCIDSVGSGLHKFACSWRAGKTPGMGFLNPQVKPGSAILCQNGNVQRHVECCFLISGNQFSVDLECHKKKEPKYSSSLFTK